ncbi:hypothetical protein EVAR_46906_1 [Eumeta japonica]|uniref:Uncharacterized protein n=1 Tax=Eumeta variegata TaxID=151549 RepID=A0A4C1XY89_EUMVA|nr:hypothetical protein EVAR_46906_1 [Eumeta japonica]
MDRRQNGMEIITRTVTESRIKRFVQKMKELVPCTVEGGGRIWYIVGQTGPSFYYIQVDHSMALVARLVEGGSGGPHRVPPI